MVLPMTDDARPDPPAFSALGLDARLVAALSALGYEEPTPIQAEAIPPLLAGRDMLGQAATGTGKTAAFALPLLQRLAASPRTSVFGLVLVPTRELAMQVAEAVHKYGRAFDARVLAVYGGQALMQQVRALDRGVDVVVATPGRALDLLGRGSLKLEAVRSLVLDEADEMLDMGFAEDLEAILSALPASRQTALFSATLPPRISQLAERHLKDPARIEIRRGVSGDGAAGAKVRQTAYLVPRAYKMAALSRVLDVENPTSALVFCRTRTEVDEVTGTLNSRGLRAEALHGGMSQEQRDRVMKRFRAGTAELLIATDVAARGLDVDRITHVVNYDIPYDTESYIHRIGRTGRAGRTGDAILFVAPRERRLLSNIEKATKQKVEEMGLPSTEAINNKRIARFKQNITDTLAEEGLSFYTQLIEQYQQEHNVSALEIASALAKLVQGDTPLLMQNPPKKPAEFREEKGHREGKPGKERKPRRSFGADIEMELFRIEVGHIHGVKPGNIVGAIANETGIDGDHIARIKIENDYSTVELPAGMPKELLKELKKIRVAGQPLNISRMADSAGNQAKEAAAKKLAKSKKRVGSTSKRAK